jgi:hypothetical protein
LAFRFVLNVHLGDVLALVRRLALVRPVFSEPLIADGAEVRSVGAAPQERPDAHRESDEAPPDQMRAARSSRPYGVAGRSWGCERGRVFMGSPAGETFEIDRARVVG